MLRKITPLLLVLIFGSVSILYGQSDTTIIKNIVYEWSDAHNSHDIAKLSNLYAPELLFYCKNRSKDECIKIKADAFKGAPDFRQKIISNIAITFYKSGIIKCEFTKDVSFKDKWKSYPSYLLLENENNEYLIVGESDKITDANMNYDLNLGPQIMVENATFFNKSIFIYIICGAILLGIGLFYILKLRIRKKDSKLQNNLTEKQETYIPPNEYTADYKPNLQGSENTAYIPSPILEARTEIVKETIPQENTDTIIITPAIGNIPEQKNKFQTAANVSKKGLEATGHFMTKVLDLAESIDRRLYNNRLKLFIGLSFTVVIIAPFIDWATHNWYDRWTAWSTFLLFIFLVIMTFAWVGSLRDDEGKWSLRRVRKRIWTYVQINIDAIKDSFSLSKEEKFYSWSKFLILGAFCWKALQNVSVLIRKPYEKFFHTRLDALRSFEKNTNHWTIWVFIAGVVILIFAIIQHKDTILEYLRRDFFPFLKSKQTQKSEANQFQLPTTGLILNAKDKNQIESFLTSKNPELFNQLVASLQKWTPRDCQNEDDFQNSFHRQLKRNIPHATVEREYYINADEVTDKRKCRKADIVIDDTILVEMKSSFRTTEMDRAKTQVEEYAYLWDNRGPVILLLCNANYEQAKNDFNSKLTTLAQQDKKVIAFVCPK